MRRTQRIMVPCSICIPITRRVMLEWLQQEFCHQRAPTDKEKTSGELTESSGTTGRNGAPVQRIPVLVLDDDEKVPTCITETESV